MRKSANIIALFAATSSANKEWLALNAALDMAEAGKKVLLCDTDMLSHKIADKTKILPESDMAKVLSGKDSLNLAATHYKNGGFDIIAGNILGTDLGRVVPSKWQIIKEDLRILANNYDRTFISMADNHDEQNFALFAEDAGKIWIISDNSPEALRKTYLLIVKLMPKDMHKNVIPVITMVNSLREGERASNLLAAACRKHLGFELPIGAVIRNNNTDDVHRMLLGLI